MTCATIHSPVGENRAPADVLLEFTGWLDSWSTCNGENILMVIIGVSFLGIAVAATFVGYALSWPLRRLVSRFRKHEPPSRFQELLWTMIFSLTATLLWRIFDQSPWSQELIPILCVTIIYLIFVQARHRRRLQRSRRQLNPRDHS